MMHSVGNVSKRYRTGIIEQRHLDVTAKVLHGLYGIREVGVSAYQDSDIVVAAESVNQHVGRDFDVDALLVTHRWRISIDQPPKLQLKVIDPSERVKETLLAAVLVGFSELVDDRIVIVDSMQPALPNQLRSKGLEIQIGPADRSP